MYDIFRKTLLTFGLLAMNITSPGCGYITLGLYRSAFLIQSLLIIITLSICWSGMIFTPLGIKILLILVASIYIANNIYLLIPLTKSITEWKLSNIGISGLFFIMSSSLFSYGFINKQKTLGFDINFVPSQSMKPTLTAGDFILLDTSSLKTRQWSTNDIVIFNRENKVDYLYVKRINEKPLELADSDPALFYMLGDNTSASYDSREFGLIHQDNFSGKAKIILFNISDPTRNLSIIR